MVPVLILIGVGVALAFYVISIYNSLKRKAILTDSAWADIDVQLKRRYDLIPNLLETVKGYASHERETLEAVIKARQQAIDVSGIANQAMAEGALSSALQKLMVVVERYPDLKANQNFMQFQEELASTENKIGFSRQHYNKTASQYNIAIEVFPANMIYGMFKFDPEKEFFELEEADQRVAPKVEF